MSQIPRPKSGIPTRTGIPQPKSRIPQRGTAKPSGIAKPTLIGKTVNEQIEAFRVRQQNAQIIKKGGTFVNVARADQLLNTPRVVSPKKVEQNMQDYDARVKQKKLEGFVKKFTTSPIPNTDCTLLPHLPASRITFLLSHSSRRCEIKACSSEDSPASLHTKKGLRASFRTAKGGRKEGYPSFVYGNHRRVAGTGRG